MSELKAFHNSAVGLSAAVNKNPSLIKSICDFYMARTDAHAKNLNTHLHWDKDEVWAEAKQQEERIKSANAKGSPLPLAGVPIVLKDNICTKGVPTTCGSKILKGFIPNYDATVVKKLRDAGAIFFGKANCDEFAMGSSNENSAYGPVKNPWDKARVPGGSSGGSAAAVAGDLAPLALGSDTGGSIRQPASLCGVVGLKPTYGRVSRFGLVAYGSSLDQIGPFGRNVLDTAALFDAIAGFDAADSTSANQPLPSTCRTLQSLKPEQSSLKGMRLGYVKEFFEEGLNPEVRAAIEKSWDVFRKLGAEVVEVSLPHLSYSIAAYYLIATAEASSNLARYDGIRYGHRSAKGAESLRELYLHSRSEGFGKEVKQRIMLGTFALSSGYYDAYYAKANRVRYLIEQDFANAFKKVQLLVSPTSPTTAFKIGEKVDDPLSMYLADICTIGVNLAGIPAISIPCGYDSKNLPIGLQIMGPKFSEESILKGSYLYEQATQWSQQKFPQLGN